MNLLLTLDENYLTPCAVLLDSFFASNPNEQSTTVYLLHSAISDDKLEELAGFCSGFGAELKPIAVDAALFENAPTSKRYPKEMYYRLLSPLILPQEVERVLYLDPDIHTPPSPGKRDRGTVGGNHVPWSRSNGYRSTSTN